MQPAAQTAQQQLYLISFGTPVPQVFVACPTCQGFTYRLRQSRQLGRTRCSRAWGRCTQQAGSHVVEQPWNILFLSRNIITAAIVNRHCVRVVKEMDSKSIGLCPQGFESPRCRNCWLLVSTFFSPQRSRNQPDAVELIGNRILEARLEPTTLSLEGQRRTHEVSDKHLSAPPQPPQSHRQLSQIGLWPAVLHPHCLLVLSIDWCSEVLNTLLTHKSIPPPGLEPGSLG